MKKYIAVMIVVFSMMASGCATKNDKDMYKDYTTPISIVSTSTLEYFSKQIGILADSLEYATTPLERHLVREAIVELQYDIQEVSRATNGNDVVMKLASKADKLLAIVGGTVVGYKGMEVLGDVLDASGTTSADNGSTVNINKEENHITTAGDNNIPTLKEPVVIEVPMEVSKEAL
jgi:hypothetical protein